MRASSSPVTSERMKRGEKILDTTAKNIRRRRGQCESHAMAYTHASPGAIPLCAYFPQNFSFTTPKWRSYLLSPLEETRHPGSQTADSDE